MAGEEQRACLGPPRSTPPLPMQPRVSATHFFLNMERWGEVMGAPSGDGPKDSVC